MRSADARLLLPAGDRGEPVHYDAYVARSGATHLLPRRRSVRDVVERSRARVRWRRVSSSDVVGDATPAVVDAACPGATVRRVTFEVDPRRRAAFFVTAPAERDEVVVKAARAPGEAARGAAEQQTLGALASLRLDDRVPSPLGHGDLAGTSWSAESVARGRPMSRTSRRWRRRHGLATLGALASWLDELAAMTRHDAAGAIADRLPIHESVRTRVEHLRAFPVTSTLVHGDLASGDNVLVDRRSFTIIDWETAVDDGVPLTDLVPTLALGVARLQSATDPQSQAAYVLELCRGAAPESEWLFERVSSHLARLAIPVADAGTLATLAWAYQGSMRARHDDLVRASGATPVEWVSPAELVLDAWVDDTELGAAWTALTAWAVRTSR